MAINKKEVYALLKKIPAGKVTTYKVIARLLGTKAYRAVGQILKDNPEAPKVPCHRVVRSDGTLGGYMGSSTASSTTKKKALLMREGIRFQGNRIVDFEKIVTALK